MGGREGKWEEKKGEREEGEREGGREGGREGEGEKEGGKRKERKIGKGVWKKVRGIKHDRESCGAAEKEEVLCAKS